LIGGRAIRILVLNYEFPPVGGGGGRVAEDICRALVSRGHTIRVLTSHVAGLPRQERRFGFDIYRASAFRSRRDRCTPLEMTAYVGLGAGRAVRDALCWKPDLIHAHFAVPTGALAWLTHQVTRIPYVLTAHLGDVPGGMPSQTDRLFRLVKPFTIPIWKSAAAITAVSEYTRRLAVSAYGLPVETVFNGVNLDDCRPGSTGANAPRRLVFAGRFNPQKNLVFLVDLLGRIRDLPWTMELLGDGEQRAAVEARIATLGLGERIRLRGWVPPEKVEAVMQKGDILVLPSLTEGLSVVAVRALAYGLAVLASDAGGNIDIVRDGTNGFLCPVNDLEAFERRLRTMLASDERLAAMKRASRTLSHAFDLQAIARRYEEIFEAVRRGTFSPRPVAIPGSPPVEGTNQIAA
jgi:glycosyltransferase involved in cell wall biosynthesis